MGLDIYQAEYYIGFGCLGELQTIQPRPIRNLNLSKLFSLRATPKCHSIKKVPLFVFVIGGLCYASSGRGNEALR